MDMSRESLKLDLYRYLRARPNVHVNGEELAMYAHSLGYKASNGERRLRELAVAGEKSKRDGKQGGYVLSDVYTVKDVKCVWFWYVPSVYEVLKQRVESGQLTLR